MIRVFDTQRSTYTPAISGADLGVAQYGSFWPHTFCQTAGVLKIPPIVEHSTNLLSKGFFRMIKKVFCILNISSQMDIKRNWGSNSGKVFFKKTIIQLPEKSSKIYFLPVILKYQ